MKKMKEQVKSWIAALELTKQEKRNLFIIGIFTVLITIGIQIQSNQPFNGILQRSTYGEGVKVSEFLVELKPIDGNTEDVDESIEIDVRLGEEQYTSEELEIVFEESIVLLDTLILGQNEEVDYVTKPLSLVEEIEGMAVSVTWDWEPYELMDREGILAQEYITEDGVLLQLEGTITYGEESMTYLKTVCVYPEELDTLDWLQIQLEESIAQLEEEGVEEGRFILPNEWGGYELIWYEPHSYDGFIVAVTGILVMILLLLRKEEEKKREYQKRMEQMERDYPEIIQTFALYMGAGMTAKNIWKRMVLEQEEKGDMRYIHQEMRRTYHEMSNGISEVMCYESFAKRCGLRCYGRMGVLLSQNVRKGTKGLTRLLEEEAREAFQIRMSRARQLGEEAGMKLLMPMFLMLTIVLTIIVVPAFLSIQI